MDFEDIYEIDRTADFIRSGSFTRVALQFPDELLKDSRRVVNALRQKLRSSGEENGDGKEVRLFLMADTAYGSCCVDEVGASHADAECVVHYGHTCLSPFGRTSTLPAFMVLGKASIKISDCANTLSNFASTCSKPILVLFGLEYAHAIPNVKEELIATSSTLSGSESDSQFHFSDVMCSIVNPAKEHKNSDELLRPVGDFTDSADVCVAAGSRHSIGGLIWDLPGGHKMEEYSLFWIGSQNSAFSNVVLTFSICEIDMMQKKIAW